MPIWLSTTITIFTAVLASSGLWAFLQKLMESKDAKAQMVKGLGHMEILRLCAFYEERGWVSDEEYDDLYIYLYKPYKDMKGNGSAERAMNKINNLPRRKED